MTQPQTSISTQESTSSLTPEAIALIVEVKARLGQDAKFTGDGILNDQEYGDLLYEVAENYVQTYSGDFDYMQSLQSQFDMKGTLSSNQIAGALNCMAAEIRRMEKKASDTLQKSANGSITRVVQNGYYTVVMEDGSYMTLRLKDSFRSSFSGEQVACYLAGPNNEHDYVSFAFVQGGNVMLFKRFSDSHELRHVIVGLLSDPEEAKAMGIAYAKQSGNCYVCNRTLTTPESIEAGIGPTCAGKGAA